jgi:hypothetical protein|uniref:Uncharacterized protein n=1 Tax=viral metagenome TaxID=1070528 RepID=A0A6C0BRH8_9ZZZZ
MDQPDDCSKKTIKKPRTDALDKFTPIVYNWMSLARDEIAQDTFHSIQEMDMCLTESLSNAIVDFHKKETDLKKLKKV